MNITQLKAAQALGCRIQIWHLRPGATSSANGQWGDADPTFKPTFECPEHLYRVHPDDLRLLCADNERRARELLAQQYRAKGIDGDMGNIAKGPWSMEEDASIRAIVAALEEAPAVSVGGEAVAWIPSKMLERMKSGEIGGTMASSKREYCNDKTPVPIYTRPAPPVVGGAMVGHAAIEVPYQECYSNDDGDIWLDSPDDAEFIGGLGLGDTYELSVSHYSIRRTYQVTKVPDEVNDDYEVAAITPQSADAALAQPQCAVCEPDGLYDTEGNGPWDCYSCGKKAQPQDREAQAVDLEQQFREAVGHWKWWYAPHEICYIEADRLLSLIDTQSAKGDIDA